MSVAVEIEHLRDYADYLPLVAGWIFREFWVGREGYSVETFEGLLGEATDPDRIPLSLLALVDGVPAGTVNLIHNDDRKRPHLHPWLAALIVLPEYRHRGIGSALVNRLIEEARRLGCTELYLGADIPGFYERLGARHFEQASETLSIMRIPLWNPIC